MIRPRLLFRTTTMVLAVALLAGLASLGLAAELVWERQVVNQREALEALMDVVGPTAAGACFAGDRALAEQVVKNLVATPNVQGAILIAGPGVLAQDSRPAAPGPAQRPAALSRRLASPFSREVQVGELVLLPDPMEARRQGAGGVRSAAAFLLGQTVVLALALVLAVHGFIIRPITACSRSLETGGGRLLEVPRGHGGDEIGQLVLAVNGLVKGLVRADWKEQEARRGQAPAPGRDPAGTFVMDGDGALEAWTPAWLDSLGLKDDPPQPGANFAALFGAGAAEAEACLERCRAGAGRAEAMLEAGGRQVRLTLDRIGPDWYQGQVRAAPEVSAARAAGS